MILNGFPFLLAFLITLVVGIGMGLLNGFNVMKLRITPVIATLVTLNLFKGIALLIVPDGTSAIKSTATQKMPAMINNYARQDVLLGLPLAFFVAIAVIIALVIVQRKTVLGKYAAAIGGNRTAAELSGISAVKYVWILYVMVGFFAAAAGVARASYMSLGDPLSGDGMETRLHHRRAAGGNRLLGRRRVGREDDDRRHYHHVCNDRLDDRHPRLLADPGDGQRAPHRRRHQPPDITGKSKSVAAAIPLPY